MCRRKALRSSVITPILETADCRNPVASAWLSWLTENAVIMVSFPGGPAGSESSALGCIDGVDEDVVVVCPEAGYLVVERVQVSDDLVELSVPPGEGLLRDPAGV